MSHSSSVGESSDAEYNVVLSRYEEYLDGEPTIIIDRDLGKCEINGTDYFEKKNSMLN